MEHEGPAYGLWGLVVINAAIFILFARTFVPLNTPRDWRAFGGFSAFIVALFAEMYGFPLTIYLLSGWLQTRYPQLDLFAHDSGHLWHTLLRMPGNPHFDPLHILSNLLLIAGFLILSRSWEVLYHAQRDGRLATTGPYAVVRHPQYGAFILLLLGFLLQWPTLLTLLMFPVLVVMYVRLAHAEEREALNTFGEAYRAYAAVTPGFVPRWPTRGSRPSASPGVAA